MLALALGLFAGPALAADTSLVVWLPSDEVSVEVGARTLHLLALGADGAPLVGAKLKVAATSGKVGAVRALGGGLYAVDWTPADAGPQTLVARGRGPDKAPLEATAVLGATPPTGSPAVAANPAEVVLDGRAEATLSLSGVEGNPIARTSAGKVANVTSLGGGRYTALYAPQGGNAPQFGIVAVAEQGDPTGRRAHVVVPLHGAVQYPVKAPAGATVVLRVGGREFGPVVVGEGGAATVPITVPPGVTSATQITVIGGEPTESAIDLGIPETRRVALFPGPSEVAADAVVPVRAVVLAPDGAPELTAPRFSATAGTFGAPVHEGKGVWRADWSPGAAGEATLVVTGRSDAQTDAIDVRVVAARPGKLAELAPVHGSAVRRVVVATSADGVAPGATAQIAAFALDPFGHPVADVPIGLSVDGDGQLGAATTTGPSGVALVTYTPGATTGPVRIRATAGSRSGEAVLVQGAAAPELPEDALAHAWEAVLRGTGAPAPAPVVAPIATAPAALGPLTVRVDPATATAGGQVTFYVHSDAGAGQELDLMASEGRFGAVSDLGEGDYLVHLAVPKKAAEELKVTFAAGDGSAFVKVPVAPPPPRPAREPSGEPWLRARASFLASSYRFEQTPYATDNALLPQVLTVGYGAGPAAGAPGFSAGARAFVPSLPYLGFAAEVRAGFYGIASDAFHGEARDALITGGGEVIGRYPFEAGPLRLHVGGRVGVDYGDFVYFTGSVDEATVRWDTLGVTGLGLAVEVGAELGDGHAVLSLREGLAYFTSPYATTLDLRGGWTVTGPLFLDVGLSSSWRRIVVAGATSGADLGDLKDGQLAATVGVGLAL